MSNNQNKRLDVLKLLNEITILAKKYTNDQELGSKIRKLINDAEK